jgi:outer membrane protein assembly factor BamE (lipoprotein component of BamABCDE complex)
MKYFVILSAFFLLSACSKEFAELNIGNFSPQPTNLEETADKKEQVASRFNSIQLQKLQVGLVSQDVLEILGKPDETSKQTCGRDGFFYKCAIWRYGEKNVGQANLFFNRDFKRLYLIKFSIEELSGIPKTVQ